MKPKCLRTWGKLKMVTNSLIHYSTKSRIRVSLVMCFTISYRGSNYVQLTSLCLKRFCSNCNCSPRTLSDNLLVRLEIYGSTSSQNLMPAALVTPTDKYEWTWWVLACELLSWSQPRQLTNKIINKTVVLIHNFLIGFLIGLLPYEKE
jgi:hypothetical protein